MATQLDFNKREKKNILDDARKKSLQIAREEQEIQNKYYYAVLEAKNLIAENLKIKKEALANLKNTRKSIYATARAEAKLIQVKKTPLTTRSVISAGALQKKLKRETAAALRNQRIENNRKAREDKKRQIAERAALRDAERQLKYNKRAERQEAKEARQARGIERRKIIARNAAARQRRANEINQIENNLLDRLEEENSALLGT